MNKFRGFILRSTLFSMIVLCSFGMFILSYITNAKSGGSNDFLASVLNSSSYKPKPFNILLLGGDNVAGNTDTMMVVNYNPDTHKVALISIPRDTKVTLGGASQKINATYNFYGKGKAGIKGTMDTLGNLLGMKIDHYAFIDLSSFRKVVDILGGVDYNIPCDMKYTDSTDGSNGLTIDFKKGMQHLDGKKAEEFMRYRKDNNSNKLNDPEYRKYYDGGDLKRIDAQQGFIKELIRQKATVSNVTKAKPIATEILQKVETDIDLNTITAIAFDTDSLKFDNIKMFKLSVYDSESFVVFDGQITDQSDGKLYPVSEIVEKYFLGTTSLGAKSLDDKKAPTAVPSNINNKPVNQASPATVRRSIKPVQTTSSRKPNIKSPSPDPDPPSTEPPSEEPSPTKTKKIDPTPE